MILLLVTGVGLVARVFAAPDRPPGEVAYRMSEEERPTRDSVVLGAGRRNQPLRTGEKINLDVAPAGELVRLPRVGPELARRLVRYRETHGGFGALERVGDVPGIGPVILKAIRPYATFEARRRRAPVDQGATARVSLNTANVKELTQLPGIGPVKARSIVEFRRTNGGFGSVKDLLKVPGIGEVTVSRVEKLVRVP